MRQGVRQERIEPLWDRVDRNRWKMGLFLVVFTVALAASAEVLLIGPVALVVAIRGDAPATVFLAGGPAMLVVAAAWVLFALTRTESRLMSRLRATRVPTGELPETKRVLHDMSIAVGLEYPPALFTIDTTSVNAFILGRKRESAVVGVTTGLLRMLTVDEQRAVFANLLARLRDGDVLLATVVSALMAPVWAMRDADLRAPDDELVNRRDTAYEESPMDGWAFLFPLYLVAVVVTELLYHGQMQQQILTSEAADARGMLLLKDPRHMLGALERAIPEDNLVPTAGAALAPLFFCWSGMAYVGDDDPETRRVSRLRETLGAAAVDEHEDASAYLPPSAPRVG